MKILDALSAIAAGGWDPRFAVTLAFAAQGDVAAALVDPNGDEADLDLDVYLRDPDGNWQASVSGSAAEEGACAPGRSRRPGDGPRQDKL